jgi:multidrug resistance efflux pump
MLKMQATREDFPAIQLVKTGNFVRVCGRVTFVLFFASALALIFIPWRQTARGTGTVVALNPQERMQSILSPTTGVISFVKEGIREGSYVEKDDIVLRMTPQSAEGVTQLETQITATESKESAAISSMEVSKQAAELQVSSGKNLAESLKQDYQAAKLKWDQAKNEMTALQAELDDKRNQLRIAEEVAQRGLVSKEELFTKRQAVESQTAKVAKAQSGADELYASLLSKEEEIEAKMQEIDIKNREANQKVLEAMQKVNTIEKEIIDLRNRRSEFDRLEVKAPRSGHIQQWFGVTGSDFVKEGEQLFVIVPDATELSVEMKISGNDMPLIQESAQVRLQFEGWPAVQFVGWPSVAVGTFGGKVNRVFPTSDLQGNFLVSVTPENHFARENGWPDDRYLRQGVRVNGWIILKQVPLGYEIWRQLNGFPPVISQEEPKKNDEKASKVKIPKL